jgi:ribulose-bisphosphate carboxylase large chain
LPTCRPEPHGRTAISTNTRHEFTATYFIETPIALEQAADVLAGEQSSGTFVRVAGETDALRDRARARLLSIEQLEDVTLPTLPNDFLRRREVSGPYHRGIIRVGFPIDNVGVNLPTLAATAAGNIYDLGELTAVRLLGLDLPRDYAASYQGPRYGVAGTRRLIGIDTRPVIGTIIKPNVGLTPEDTATLVARLCEAGVDFIKDDEVMANPPHAPFAARVAAVMRGVNAHADRTGRKVMVAFNVSDETDAMRRHAELVAAAGGTCVMVSINWVGLGGLETLRRSTDLAIHGHRNGFAMFTRCPGFGMDFAAYQVFWRLAGVDHLHVNGLSSKFWESDDSVAKSARACLCPIIGDDAVMPVFSAGQSAATVEKTWRALGSADLIFLAGGGIIGHPGGPAAGVESIRAAWEAVTAGIPVQDYAHSHPALAAALARFGDAR